MPRLCNQASLYVTSKVAGQPKTESVAELWQKHWNRKMRMLELESSLFTFRLQMRDSPSGNQGFDIKSIEVETDLQSDRVSEQEGAFSVREKGRKNGPGN